MAIFVYITDRCKDEAIQHGIHDRLASLKSQVEAQQTTDLFDRFPSPYLVRRKFGAYNLRLIAEKRHIEDHLVIIFLAILVRGSADYQRGFGRDPIEYGNQHFAHLVQEADLYEYLEHRTAVDPPAPKDEPNVSEWEFLLSCLNQRDENHPDGIVYETEAWKTRILNDVTRNHLNRFPLRILEWYLDDNIKLGLNHYPIPDSQNLGALFYKHSDWMFLLAPTSNNYTQDQAFADFANLSINPAEIDSIIKISNRAYPITVLENEDMWIALENEPVANMALSPEESQVLQSSRGASRRFPLFINGRAGSGKSTILQYLFADILSFFRTLPQDDFPGTPIYLTANGDLLNRAREFVGRLVQANANYAQRIVGPNGDINPLLDDCFREFHTYLRSLLPLEDVRSQQFHISKRIDYSQFRNLWMEWFGNEPAALRNYSPDLSWHVIRSYIKGRSRDSDDFLEPEDYAEVPTQEKTVSEETYRLIFNNVWKERYSVLSKEGYWDDQDLARYILDNQLATPIHPAVFCDEAQDFTRIELEVILRLSLFSNRSINHQYLHFIPFALAGDPFQTLNPTGFRWEAIKAAFVEKLIHALDPAGRLDNPEMNFQELRFNYRSTSYIVRFSNSIQALRTAVFDIPELRPQLPWGNQPNPQPVLFFQSTDSEFWRNQAGKGFVYILPCDQDRESEFVRNDPNLSVEGRIPRSEDGIPQNVLSSARAKGSEFPTVIVYGFGEHCSVDPFIDREGNVISNLEDRRELSLPGEYFLNRLYVAVSRPKERLIIVDTPDGFNRLWKFATDVAITDRVRESADQGRNLWLQEHLTHMEPGSPDNLVELVVNNHTLAAEYEARGLATFDAYWFKQAEMTYTQAGDEGKKLECRARWKELQEEYLEAGDLFSNPAVGLVSEDAVRCYWKQQDRSGWKRLVNLAETTPQVRNRIQYRVAFELIQETPSLPQALDQLLREALIPQLRQDEILRSAVSTESSWKVALTTLFRLMTPYIERETENKFFPNGVFVGNLSDKDYVSELSNTIRELDYLRVETDPYLSSLIFFRAGDYTEALRRWPENRRRTELDIRILTVIDADTKVFPDCLTPLGKLGKHDDIIKRFEDSFPKTDRPLQRDHWKLIAKAYQAKGLWVNAIAAVSQSQDAEMSGNLAKEAHNQGMDEVAVKALEVQISGLVAEGKWTDITSGVLGESFRPDVRWTLSKSRQKELQAHLVRCLSRSAEFGNAESKHQKTIVDCLENFLRVDSGLRVSVEEAGGAFERGGRFTKSLSFYEAVLKGKGFNEVQIRFAKERWLKCKQKQIEYDESLNRHVEESKRRLAEEMKGLGLTHLDALTEFPVLQPLSIYEFQFESSANESFEEGPTQILEDHQKVQPTDGNQGDTLWGEQAGPVEGHPDRLEITLGPLRMSLSRRLGRCNFEHQQTMAQTSFKFDEGSFTGDVNWDLLEDNKWGCSNWNLSLTLAPERLVLLDLLNGISVTVKL